MCVNSSRSMAPLSAIARWKPVSVSNIREGLGCGGTAPCMSMEVRSPSRRIGTIIRSDAPSRSPRGIPPPADGPVPGAAPRASEPVCPIDSAVRILVRAKLRSCLDPGTGQTHISNHDVDEEEVEELLTSPGEDRPGRDGSRVAIGQTAGGRYLRMIYVRDPEPESVFVITAYEPRGKPLPAYRRRQRRRRQ
jgi:hypothetical protein